MKAMKLMTLGLLVSVSASAGVLTTTPATPAKKIEGVDVLKGGSFAGQSGALQVNTIGAALRTKSVAGLPIKVYVAHLMVSDPGKFSRNNQALDSLAGMTAVAFQLKTLMTVSNGQLVQAMADAFASNGIPSSDANSVAGKVIAFGKTSGSWDSGKTFTVVGQSLPNGTDVVTLENTKGATATITAPGAIRTVLALWLGTLPANDAGLLKLKAELIAGSQL